MPRDVAAREGASDAPFARGLANATAALPDGRPTRVYLPTTPDAPLSVRMRQPGFGLWSKILYALLGLAPLLLSVGGTVIWLDRRARKRARDDRQRAFPERMAEAA